MANFTPAQITTAVAQQNAAIEYKQSTATPFVTPTFQSVTNATTGGTPVNLI